MRRLIKYTIFLPLLLILTILSPFVVLIAYAFGDDLSFEDCLSIWRIE